MSTIDFRGESNIREGLGITPVLGERVMIDPSAVVMGDVTLGDDVSVWPHAAMRGDVQAIRIGARTNIQDGTVLHVTHDGPYNPGGFPLHIGEDVTLGHRALLHGCTVGNRVLVGGQPYPRSPRADGRRDQLPPLQRSGLYLLEAALPRRQGLIETR